MKTLILRKEVVQAAMLSAGKKDLRVALNGVYIHNNRIVATDGHRMFIATIHNDENVPNCIIPRENVEQALKSLLKGQCSIPITFDGERYTINNLPFDPHQIVYPDYERLLPRNTLVNDETLDPLAQMLPEYGVDAYKAHKLMGGFANEAFWCVNKSYILCGDTWLQMIMPQRLKKLSPLPNLT